MKDLSKEMQSVFSGWHNKFLDVKKQIQAEKARVNRLDNIPEAIQEFMQEMIGKVMELEQEIEQLKKDKRELNNIIETKDFQEKDLCRKVGNYLAAQS